MDKYTLKISLGRDLSNGEYQKLVEFLKSEGAKYRGGKPLEIIRGGVRGNPPFVRGVVIGLRQGEIGKSREFAEKSRDAARGLIDILYELGTLR